MGSEISTPTGTAVAVSADTPDRTRALVAAWLAEFCSDNTRSAYGRP